MGKISKQVALYIGLLLVCSTFTIISAFYPDVAKKKGIPFWMIGVILALNPAAKLPVSILIGKYMNVLGRKRVVIMSFVFTSISMLTLSPIQNLDKTSVILLSVIARVSGGLGSACIFSSITTIFISDYPKKVQTMIGRMEASIGIGLLLGPLIGIGLYLINLFIALLAVGVLIIAFAPVAWKMLGTFRQYMIKDINIKRMALFAKPVSDT